MCRLVCGTLAADVRRLDANKEMHSPGEKLDAAPAHLIVRIRRVHYKTGLTSCVHTQRTRRKQRSIGQSVHVCTRMRELRSQCVCVFVGCVNTRRTRACSLHCARRVAMTYVCNMSSSVSNCAFCSRAHVSDTMRRRSTM